MVTSDLWNPMADPPTTLPSLCTTLARETNPETTRPERAEGGRATTVKAWLVSVTAMSVPRSGPWPARGERGRRGCHAGGARGHAPDPDPRGRHHLGLDRGGARRIVGPFAGSW